jgi:toxic protein SymE
MSKTNTRTLTIHSKYRALTYGSTIIPEIRLEGKWLQELGFKMGQKVKIVMEENRLVITPQGNDE